MAKIASSSADMTIDTDSMEEYTTDIGFELTQALPVTTCFADAGPRRVTGNYDYAYTLAGNNDFATTLPDSTIYGLIASTGVAVTFDPTGATAASDNPNYDSTSSVLESYSISGSLDDAIKFSATLRGNSAISRAVA